MSPESVASADAIARRVAYHAALVLRLAYVFPAYWILTETLNWREFSIRQSPDLLWPVAWAEGLDPMLLGKAVQLMCVLALLASGVFPQFRWTRICGAFALTEYLALRFSLGKIHHMMHGWLLCLWLLCWLPVGWTAPDTLRRKQRQLVLRLFHACQVLTATTYTLSGVGKILGAGYQWWRGEATFFGFDSVARHTAARLLETPGNAVLGDWAVRHGAWLWPGAMALLALQLGAVWLAVRPHFHVALGAGLITFHALTALTMGIDFSPAVVLCAFLFLASPFTTTSPGCR